MKSIFYTWSKKNNFSAYKIAKKIDVTPQTIYNIFKLKNPPNLELALKIEKLTDGQVDIEGLLKDYKKHIS